MSVASGAVVGVVCFLLVYQRSGCTWNRVRIIYKTIRRLKGSTSHVHLDMGQDIVEQVNRDVMTWADSQIEDATLGSKTFQKGVHRQPCPRAENAHFQHPGIHPDVARRRVERPRDQPQIPPQSREKRRPHGGVVGRFGRLITKMESGTLDIELVPSIAEIIRETMESLEPKARRSRLI